MNTPERLIPAQIATVKRHVELLIEVVQELRNPRMPLKTAAEASARMLAEAAQELHALTTSTHPLPQQAQEPVATGKQPLQVQCWVIPNGDGAGQFSWEPQDERFWTRMAPQPDNTALMLKGIQMAILNAGLTLLKTQHGYKLEKFGPAVALQTDSPTREGHPADAGFELWWAEYMPNATQSVAIKAWNAAQPTVGDTAVMQQALEALEAVSGWQAHTGHHRAAITALREALPKTGVAG